MDEWYKIDPYHPQTTQISHTWTEPGSSEVNPIVKDTHGNTGKWLISGAEIRVLRSPVLAWLLQAMYELAGSILNPWMT